MLYYGFQSVIELYELTDRNMMYNQKGFNE